MRWHERDIIRLLHLILSIPIVGYLYGPVEHIARAAFFVRWIAFPVVVLSGFWLWLKPRIAKRVLQHRLRRSGVSRTIRRCCKGRGGVKRPLSRSQRSCS